MKASDYIAHYIAERNVSHVFELIGGMTTHLIDSIGRLGKTQIICVHHEQAAAFAVDGMGRMLGKPAVALATSGPGATNLLTGIGSCYFDSVPAVFITGQVNVSELRGSRAIRQLGFQETDIVSMARPVTKFSHQMLSIDELPESLEKAFNIASSGRPGPVLLDIPMDIQCAEITPMEGSVSQQNSSRHAPNCDDLNDIFDAIKTARRPLILAGGGIHSACALDQFRRLVEELQIPVVCSLMAVDVLPYRHPLRVGMIGTYGNRWANLALGRSDLLLILGSRLDVRQTGSDIDYFKRGRSIIHFDCDPGEVNNRVTDCKPILGDLQESIDSLIGHAVGTKYSDRSPWISEITNLRNSYPDIRELDGIDGINPNQFLHELSYCSPSASAFIADVGQHQMWAAQSLELLTDQRFLTSGGMGAMGFALPAAIGASFSCGKVPVVMIAGDGGFQCNIQELQTIARNKLPLKMVVLNNQCLGMVRQFQESYFGGHYQSTMIGYSAPDFSTIAHAYGIPALTIAKPDECDPACRWLWESDGPSLLQVILSPKANAYPKIAFGSPLTTMEPAIPGALIYNRDCSPLLK